ncbi:Clp amino terminal domain-containing protein [Raphanus sativus]|uniref:Protein SMAX1-LIKE 5 n=1 Tax=Raphanus sativus TaxID=3726 RepID=A0A6J0LAG5_RAPSA|nr:protein SMAX1-LIKE 5 [Raphanus sativus]KAJ4875322.1 Clp amino terminal domain-containing protein [Raphanus sativus]
MRTGGYTIQQTLTTEAASVLKQSLTLARRRGHAQVTPLHVAATLLSSRTSLLRRACIKSHPGFTPNYQFAPSLHHHQNQNHPLQCRALELCFNVALNRLPTIPGPMFHGQPSLANALVAALKRAQAHQRRDCIEQQQQQQTQTQTQQTQLLAVKVELEQLVISILDDPSVSRVMREAGFNSTAVKNCVEECSVSSVFYAGGSVVGVFSSPNSPDQQPNINNNMTRFHHHYHNNPKDFNFLNPNVGLWQTHFSNQSPNQNPLFISSSSSSPHQYLRENDLKLVVDVLLRKKTKKKKNPVIVGDSVSFTEVFVSELMGRLERGELGDLKQTHLVKFQFSPMASKFMRREDVEMNLNELRKKVVSLTTSGKNVIIFTGDLTWTIREVNSNNSGEISPPSYSPLDHLVEEIGKLIADYDDEDVDDDGSKTRVWVMGTASFQTYMRCQMRQPSLETLWALHPVSVPSSANLGLSLHATSGHDQAWNMSSVNATKSFSGYNKAEEEETISSVLSCCPECVSSFEREAKALKANQEKLLPSWLQSHDGDNSPHKEELMGLRRKWNRVCEHIHNQTRHSSLMGSRSVSLIDSFGLMPNHQRATNSIAKFRRQTSCTIEFDLGGNGYEKGESINEAEADDDNENVKTTLDLGRSLFPSDSVTETRKKISALVKTLEESVPWQTVTMRLVAECLMDSVLDKKDGWIMIEGNDRAAKRSIARTVAESVFGSFECLVHIDLKKNDNESKVRGLEKGEKVVFLIEDIDLADSRFLKLLAHRFEENRTGINRQAIFILTKEDNARNRESVLQINLEVMARSAGRKRKPVSDLPVKEGKIKKEAFSRQSSFNSSYLDLNLKAEEDIEGEISPISSDLTGEEETEISSSTFLNMIQNRFVLNRSYQPGIEKAMITAAFREVFPEEGDGGGVRFSVEEKLVEEISSSGNLKNGAFESWLKEVFKTGLLTVKKGGEKDTGVIRMVFGGIVDNNNNNNKQYGGGVGGYMGTCLPNKVQVSKFE